MFTLNFEAEWTTWYRYWSFLCMEATRWKAQKALSKVHFTWLGASIVRIWTTAVHWEWTTLLGGAAVFISFGGHLVPSLRVLGGSCWLHSCPHSFYHSDYTTGSPVSELWEPLEYSTCGSVRSVSQQEHCSPSDTFLIFPGLLIHIMVEVGSK